jgi:hypothetical protein
MTEPNEKTNFAGTYFNRDSILRLARIADIFAWVALAYFLAQAAVSALVFILQIARGLVMLGGPTDYAQQLIWMLQPVVPGVLYFVGIQAIGKALLIFMDIEDNLRRIARNKS